MYRYKQLKKRSIIFSNNTHIVIIIINVYICIYIYNIKKKKKFN